MLGWAWVGLRVTIAPRARNRVARAVQGTVRLRGLALLIGGIALFAGVASASEHSVVGAVAAQGATTWTLVNGVCKPGQNGQPAQVQVGRGCYDPSGATDAGAWQVSEGTATWTEQTYTTEYMYSVPDQIPPAGATVELGTTANDVTNNSGIDTQICIQSPFQVKESGDACATAAAPTPGSSASGSKTLTLLPDGAPVTENCPGGGFGCVTLTVGFIDGGHVYFTYRAAAAKRRHVSYGFNEEFRSPASTDQRLDAIKVSGAGSFEVNGPVAPSSTTPGSNPRGSVAIQLTFHRPGPGPTGICSVELTLSRVEYDSPPPVATVAGTYTVTRSTLSCLPVGRHIAISAKVVPRRNQGTVQFEFCNTPSRSFDDQTGTIQLKVR